MASLSHIVLGSGRGKRVTRLELVSFCFDVICFLNGF